MPTIKYIWVYSGLTAGAARAPAPAVANAPDHRYTTNVLYCKNQKLDLKTWRGVIKKASPDMVEAYAEELLQRGASPGLVAKAVDMFCRGCVADHLAALLRHGANPDEMMRYMYTQQIVEEMGLLQEYGADFKAVAMRRAKSLFLEQHSLIN